MQELLNTTRPKARKQHRCDYCDGIIDIGEVYEKQTGVCDGRMYEWKAHLTCQELASELNMFDDCEEGLSRDAFLEEIDSAFVDLIDYDSDEDKDYLLSEKIDMLKNKHLKNK